MRTDVACYAECKQAAARVRAGLGRLHLLVSNGAMGLGVVRFGQGPVDPLALLPVGRRTHRAPPHRGEPVRSVPPPTAFTPKPDDP